MSVKQWTTALVVVAAAAVNAAPALQRRGDVSLADWASQNLESYWAFRTRYNSLQCASQHDTPFYESCCYPLGAGESLSSRPENCTPSALTCGAPSAVNNTPLPQPEILPLPVPEVPTEEYCEAEEDDDDTNVGNQDQNYTPPQNNEQPPPQEDNHNPAPQPQPEQPSNPGNGGGETFSGGKGTWYEQEGLAGACGNFHGDYDMIVAMDYRRYGNVDAVSPLCGRTVHITNERNGKSIEAVIADACPTCENENSIDLSLGAFALLDDYDVGILPITWYFVN